MSDDQNSSYIFPANPRNSLLDPNYVPLTPQTFKREKVAIGSDNVETRIAKRMDESLVKGQSSDTPLGDTTYNVGMMESMVDVRMQSGSQGFPSLVERQYAVNPTFTTGVPLVTKEDQTKFLDQNPAKFVEKDAGDVSHLVYMKAALNKDSPVYFNLHSPMRDREKVTESQIIWGFKPSLININSNKKERITKTQGVPYCRIIEDRVGTAAYGYGEEMKGNFSTDVVMIEVLQNISGLRISGSRAEFQNPEPRGSQRPLYFYNKNSGRSIEFSANFHQQEYPLEPLYSIAEKAQYLLRPYRHSDYGLIPKTVRVEVPGRIFRCYCTGAEASFEGEDYRGWSELGLTETNIGSYGNAYTGVVPRIENKTNRIYNSDPYSVNIARDALTNSYFTSNDYRYGLSSMTIGFQFVILEEIKLTSYETQEEIIIREEQAKEEQIVKDRESAIQKAQQYLDEAKKNGFQIEFTAEQLVFVDKDGKVAAILINEDGVVLPPDSVNDPNLQSVEDYNKQKALENANKAASEDVQDSTKPLVELAQKNATGEDMVAFLVSKTMKEHPGMTKEEAQKEIYEKYGEDGSKNPSGLYNDYSQSIQNELEGPKHSLFNPKSDDAYMGTFLSHNRSLFINESRSGKIMDVQVKLQYPEFISNLLSINLTPDNPNALQEFGSLFLTGVENSVYFFAVYSVFKKSEVGVVISSTMVDDRDKLWYKELFFLPCAIGDHWTYINLQRYGLEINYYDFENCVIKIEVLLANKIINDYQYGFLLQKWGFKPDENKPWVELKDVCKQGNANKWVVKDKSGKEDYSVYDYILTLFDRYRKYICIAIDYYLTNEMPGIAISRAISASSSDYEDKIKTRKMKGFCSREDAIRGYKADDIFVTIGVSEHDAYNYMYYEIGKI